jgi:predicted transcriptional regulator of viral defense system
MGMDKGSSQVYRRPALLSAGFTPAELRRMRRAGDLTLLRRGAYYAGPGPDDDQLAHRALLHTTFQEMAAGTLISHASAAVLHGLPTWRLDLDRVHATRIRTSGARLDRLVHLHAARVEPDEVVEIEGLPVTSLARTVVDLARATFVEVGVVVVDAALRVGLDTDELAEVLGRSGRRPGCSKARRVVAFADGRSESVGESRSRVAIARAGLPAPVPQWEVLDEYGQLVGRVDFWWPRWRVVGEFDGKSKYGRLLRPGQDPGEVVYQEKRREDALRAESVTVVRWGWADLNPFAPTAARLHRILC